MKLALCLVIGAALLPVAYGAEWIKLSTPNFIVYASCPEDEARETLEIFEEARDFFLRAKPVQGSFTGTVTLVIFGSAKEYQPYGRGPSKPAYYSGSELGDYVVMSDLKDFRRIAAIHEYVHLLVRHSGLNLPLWLNEGMADVYSTLRMQDGKILVGATPTQRTYSLTTQRWIKMPGFVKVDMKSAEYNEAEQATVFYGQSWLLAHMLMLDSAYRDKFPAFLERVSKTGSSETAFSDTYNKSLADVERAMNAYFRQTSIGAQLFDAAEVNVQGASATPAAEVETGPLLAVLRAATGNVDDGLARLKKLAAEHPGNLGIEEAWARLEWARKDYEAALEHLGAARAAGREKWKTNWDYARISMAAGGDRNAIRQALEEAVKEKPELREARMLLDALEPAGISAEVPSTGASEFSADEEIERPVLRRAAPVKPAPPKPTATKAKAK